MAVAALSAACADSFLGNRGPGGLARIALQPRFTERDARIYTGLPTFGLGVQSLRIVLLRPGTTDTLADSTVFITEADDSVAVELTVQLLQQEEQLTAAMQMFSGSVLVFEGSRSITARAGINLTGAAPTLVPAWVGPGASATSIVISPQDTTVLINSTFQLSARAFAAGQVEVTDPDFTGRFRWRSLDTALATVTEVGGVVSAKATEGTARILVLTPNLLRDTIDVAIITEALVPGQIALAFTPAIPGGVMEPAQTTQASATVRTAGGTLLPGVPVTFASRTPGVATAAAGGSGATITAVNPGQSVVVASVSETLADSTLVVVAHPDGPVVFTDLDAFDKPLNSTFTVSVLVDMRSARKLGSGAIDVEWNPAQLAYVSHAAGASVAPTVNANDQATGKLRLAFADAAGFSNTVELLKITFTTAGTPAAGALTLVTRELNEANAAASDLLPITVTVVRSLRTQ